MLLGESADPWAGMRQQGAQAPGSLGGFNPLESLRQFSQNNPGVLGQIGAGMMAGDAAGGFANAGELQARNREKFMERQETQRKTNLTRQWLIKNRGMSEEDADMAMSSPEILNSYLKGNKNSYINAGDGNIFNETTGEWLQAPGAGRDFAKRQEAAAQYGLSPDDPAYRSFVLTGKMPREDQAPLTATDKKAILEADEMVLANQTAVDMLTSVLAEPNGPGSSLNERAGYGGMAGTQAWLARNDPTGFFNDDKGQATTELENVVLGQALANLKATFGAAPTEGERKILVDLQASTDKSPKERKAILDRAIELAQRRLEFNKQRAAELRGGTFYKPGGGSGGSNGWTDLGDGVSIRQID